MTDTIPRRAACARLALGLAAVALPRAARPADATPPDRPGLHVLPPFDIPGLGRSRTVRLWLPPSYAEHPSSRYPVVYLHDGQNVFGGPGAPWGGWGVDEALAALAARGGPQAIVVAVDHGGEWRLGELSPWPNRRQVPPEGRAYVDFVTGPLKAWVDAKLRTRPGREDTLMAGSSLGALATLDALLRHGDVVGRAALFSPAWWFCPQAGEDVARTGLRAGTRAWFYAGGDEDADMVPDFERMRAVVERAAAPGVALAWHVVPGAHHDERAWRAEFPRAIEWLLGDAPPPGDFSGPPGPAASRPA